MNNKPFMPTHWLYAKNGGWQAEFQLIKAKQVAEGNSSWHDFEVDLILMTKKGNVIRHSLGDRQQSKTFQPEEFRMLLAMMAENTDDITALEAADKVMDHILN